MDGSDNFELIVAEVNVGGKEIRIMTGYGPQENWEVSQKMPFFVALEKEVSKANINGKSVIIELDANSKLGNTYVPNDPHTMSANGKILEGIVKRNGLIVANGIRGKSEGVITRQRTTVKGVEKSVIDFVLISEDLENHITRCYIDDQQRNNLTKITKTKQGIKRKESDHNSIITNFNLKVKSNEKVKQIEIFNFKDKKGLEKFRKITSNNSELSKIFETNKSVGKQAKQFMRRLNGMLHQCFKKIKITENAVKKEDVLYRKQKELKSQTDPESKKKLAEVEEELVNLKSNDLFNIVKDEIVRIDCETGGFNSGHLWKMKAKLKSKESNKYTAIEDENGKLLTSEKDIDEETIKHYTKVLENRKIKTNLEEYQIEREKLCEERINEARKNITPDWTNENVKRVVKELKKKKSRDPHGYSNEIMQAGGEDLELAIVKMMNNIKRQQIFPECLEPCNITSLFKNKGSRKNLNFYRGIFRVSVFRNILDKLIFNDEYETIDENLTDSNVGGRKGKGIRDNLFVINAITNSVKNGAEEPCDVQVFDVEKCFDSLWVQECVNTLYENGFKNDKLVLLYEETKNAQIAIKTPNGTTTRKDIKNIIMQGTVFGSIICTSVMDKLAKIFYKDPDLVYKYKNQVEVPVLGMVDDILCVSRCSSKTVISNATVNTFMELNKLTLSAEKCSKIHIGKKCNQCPQLKVHENQMKDSHKEKYLGDFINEKGTIKDTIDNRIAKAWSYVSEIGALLSEFPFGNKKIQVGLMLREAMFLNGVLHSCEAWHGLGMTHIAQIELVDHHLMRTILAAHSKTPIEFLYLETGALPAKYVITSRRLNYLKHIHMQSDHELIKRVYQAQRDDPKRGDWWELVKSDLEGYDIDEDELKQMNKNMTRKYIKEKIYTKAFEDLRSTQSTHSKVKDIKYEKYTCQEYLKSSKFSFEEASILVALRSKTVKDIKSNIRSFSQNDQLCPLCMKIVDTQEHCLECPKLKSIIKPTEMHINYNQIYSQSESEQKAVASLFLTILERRNLLLQEGLPGTKTLDPTLYL